MKRLLLFLFFFIPVVLFAQSTVIDFDPIGHNWGYGVFGGAPDPVYSVVPNPDPSGINTSAYCGQLVIDAAAQHWSGVYFTDLPDFTLTAETAIITVMVYKDVISPFNLKLEGPNVDQRNVSNTLINQWEQITFDYSAYIGTSVVTLTIIPDHEPDSTGRTHGSINYFDNVDFGAIIPVELASFTANYVDNTVQLKWSTATELNNLGFDIQRSTAGSKFLTIGFIQGKGTTTETHNYSYFDNTITPNTQYSYRLKQIDFDGTFAYSNIVNLGKSLPVNFELSQNFPNPFNPSTKINLDLPVNSNVTLDIYNLVGEKVVSVYKGALEAGNHTYDVNGSDLSSGIYVYRLTVAGENGTQFTASKKMTLLK